MFAIITAPVLMLTLGLVATLCYAGWRRDMCLDEEARAEELAMVELEIDEELDHMLNAADSTSPTVFDWEKTGI